MKHWIQYKFRFNDDPDSPDMWMDLFLIDTAFREVIEKHKPELWRFHRRSAKDSVGHQLSLLVYTESINTVNIYDKLVLSSEIMGDHIKSISIETMQPGIENTSDTNWSEPLQKSWPYFACGSCQMIMGLMDHIPKYKKPSIDSVFEIYEPIQDEMKDFYTNNAGHAFIHHLSALFGYAPIKLQI